MDVSRVLGGLPNVEESHQVYVLAVDISDHLHWRSDVFYHYRLCSEDGRHLLGKLHNVLFLARELGPRLDVLTLLGLEERLQKHLAKGIMGILLHLVAVLLVGVQFLRLLGELID